jgi:hypothetical protein
MYRGVVSSLAYFCFIDFNLSGLQPTSHFKFLLRYNAEGPKLIFLFNFYRDFYFNFLTIYTLTISLTSSNFLTLRYFSFLLC